MDFDSGLKLARTAVLHEGFETPLANRIGGSGCQHRVTANHRKLLHRAHPSPRRLPRRSGLECVVALPPLDTPVQPAGVLARLFFSRNPLPDQSQRARRGPEREPKGLSRFRARRAHVFRRFQPEDDFSVLINYQTPGGRFGPSALRADGRRWTRVGLLILLGLSVDSIQLCSSPYCCVSKNVQLIPEPMEQGCNSSLRQD